MIDVCVFSVVCVRYKHENADGVLVSDCCLGTLVAAASGSTTQSCCVGGVVDARGACCSPPLTVDACGVCGGTGVFVDAQGVCCNGARDGMGLCCTAGVDSCGVCGGASDTCGVTTTVAVQLNSTTAAACTVVDSTLSFAGRVIASDVSRRIAASLRSSAVSVSVTSVQCSGGSGSATVAVVVAPNASVAVREPLSSARFLSALSSSVAALAPRRRLQASGSAPVSSLGGTLCGAVSSCRTRARWPGGL